MIEIEITEEDRKFISIYAEKQTLNGFSNLAKQDLQKASRYEFQLGGVAAEAGWNKYRYGNTDKLQTLLNHKFETLRPNRKGDGGYDDKITINDTTKFLDVKSSHVENVNKINFLNLIIPQREYHNNMIYVCAFTVGPNRNHINSVIIAGYALTEDIHKKWKYDENKFCVPVKDLRPIKELEQYFV